MIAKPGWVRRKVRRLIGRCPWCGKGLVNGTITLFLDGWKGCPDGHYGEQMVLVAGGAIIVYENGGESILPRKVAT